MKAATRSLWSSQDRHPGDRWRLFRAVSGAVPGPNVLYPGSFVDIAPSFVFPSVTYVDTDSRAERFFADRAGVLEIIGSHEGSPQRPQFTFVPADYTGPLGLPDECFDLLVSLYAGPVSVHCTRYLRPGGLLLVNPSHGDAGLASLDERYVLSGVVKKSSSGYRVFTENLDSYLIPKSGIQTTADLFARTGRGVAYTRQAFAYLFTRTG